VVDELKKDQLFVTPFTVPEREDGMANLQGAHGIEPPGLL